MPQCAACALPPPHFGPLRRRLEWPAVALPRCPIQTIVRWIATTTTRGWSSFGILKTGRSPGMKSGISWSLGLCLASGKWKRPLPTSKTLFACKCISIYLVLWETVCLAQWNLPGLKSPRQHVYAFMTVCSQFTILKVSRRWPLTLQ